MERAVRWVRGSSDPLPPEAAKDTRRPSGRLRSGGSRRLRRPVTAAVLLALVAFGYCGLFAANSLIRVRTFTADSMNYVDVARRVAAGDGLVQSTGGFNQPFYLSGDLDLPSAFTAQPPGYPLAIASLSGLGVEAADAALVVSALACAAVLLLVYLLGRRIGGDVGGAAALGAALLFTPLTHLGRAALSECLAVAVVLLFFLLLDRHLERPPAAGDLGSAAGGDPAKPPAMGESRASPLRGRAPGRSTEALRPSTPQVRRAGLCALALGLLAGAAFGLRYSLWPLPVVGLAALWFAGAARRAPARLLRLAAFAAGAFLPMASVLGRNLAVDGRLLPAAMPAVTTLPENLSRAVAAALGGWRSTALGNWPDAALLVVALALLGALAVRAASGADGPRIGTASRLPLLIGLWAVLYLAAVVWRSTQANFDPIGVRLALPATVALIPVFGGVIAAAAGRSAAAARQRLARCRAVRAPLLAGRWLAPAILAVCFGAAFAREAALWSSGHDARATEFRSERQQWLRDHTGPGDLVIGGGTMDVPFLFPGRFAISYAGLPYTEVLTYSGLERIADRHCPSFDRLLLVVRPTVQLGGTRSDQDPSNWLGPFIADARAGRHEAYALLEPQAVLREARVYRIACRD